MIFTTGAQCFDGSSIGGTFGLREETRGTTDEPIGKEGDAAENTGTTSHERHITSHPHACRRRRRCVMCDV